MATKKAPSPTPWRNRIVRSEVVDPGPILANPLNARFHDDVQRSALRAVLDKVGWVAPVIVNDNTGVLVDGHLRVEEALKRGEMVPVQFVDLTEEEQNLMLMAMDPIAALASTDERKLQDLLNLVGPIDSGLDALLAELAGLDPGEPEDEGWRDKPNPAASEGEPGRALDGQVEGDLNLRAMVLSYDVAVYTRIIAALEVLPGDSNADKIRRLILAE